jgi:protein-tyrosine phosphatase
MAGLIDVHSHLLPGVDDGCASLDESLACARMLVLAGYTHSFCTPHIWPTYSNTVESIPPRVAKLQEELNRASVALRLLPGGEINLRAEYSKTLPEQVVTYGLARRFALIDMWHATIPDYVAGEIRWLQSLGLTVILAHPERMRAVQDDPGLINFFTDLGVLLQGNLQCFSEGPSARAREVAEQLLQENRYFLLGTDLHALHSLPGRLAGLERARQLAGNEQIDQLTRFNPLTLLPTE